MSALEERFAAQLVALGDQVGALWIPAPEREYRFAAEKVGPGKGLRQRLAAAGLRDWRFDFAWPELRFAVEVEGGAWVYGRHNRGAGFEADLEKYHHGMRLGWSIYRCGARLVHSWEAALLVRDLLAGMTEGVESEV